MTKPDVRPQVTPPTIAVAYVPMVPNDNAATRTFCEMPAAQLGPYGIEGRVFAPSTPERKRLLSSRRRGVHGLLAAVYWYVLVLPRRLIQLPSILRHDVVLIQRSVFRFNSPPVLEAALWLGARLFGRSIVYHLDDALFTIVRPRYIALRCRMADMVLTGNADIAAFAVAAGGCAERLDGWVECDSYPDKRHAVADHVVIGYVGTFAQQHLEPIAEALATVCERTGARVRAVGRESVNLAPLEGMIESSIWTRECRFSLFEEFDIGVMPLEDTPYNRGKEAFKLKEYMASGLPSVASHVGHNPEVVEDGVHGYLVSSESEWVEALSKLVADVELRARLGAAARHSVRERFDSGPQLRQLASLLREASR